MICFFKNLMALLLVLLSADVMAQHYYEDPPKVFEGGIIGGVNFTQVDGDTYYGFHKTGIHAGGQVYVHFTPKVGMTMDIVYSQKGSRGEGIKQSAIISTYVAKYFMNLNYVEVPVLIHYQEHGFDFEAGLSYARLVSSKEWVFTDLPVTIDPVKNSFNTADIEYVAGLRIKLYKKLYGNFRYEYSIVTIRPDSKIPVSFGYGNDGQFNNMLAFRLLYMF